MNLQNIITEIEKVDPEVYDRFDSRRKVMKQFANLTGKLALAAVPACCIFYVQQGLWPNTCRCK